jgi:formylglycine-generating enzyme required for sulfatase activity
LAAAAVAICISLAFSPNKFGLYDMVGNVFQWTEDCWHAAYEIETPHGKLDAPVDGSSCPEGSDCGTHVVRGGTWLSSPRDLRSALRDGLATGDRGNYLGFPGRPDACC